MCKQFNKLNNCFDVNDKKLDKRLNESQKQYNELRGDINEVKEQQNAMSNDIRNEMRQQNVNLSSDSNMIEKCFDAYKEKWEQRTRDYKKEMKEYCDNICNEIKKQTNELREQNKERR